MSEHIASGGPPGPLNPRALPLADAARLLTRMGPTPITEAMLRADVEAGAPANSDGSLDLVRYAAWLVRQMGGGDGSAD